MAIASTFPIAGRATLSRQGRSTLRAGPRVFRTLVEQGGNLHVELIPRSRFKHMVEGSARTAFRYSFFTYWQLVYCDDPSMARWFEEADTVARREQERELCIATIRRHCRMPSTDRQPIANRNSSPMRAGSHPKRSTDAQ